MSNLILLAVSLLVVIKSADFAITHFAYFFDLIMLK